ncbi:MAG: MMPL family transporter [Thermoleophilia bacterium]
MLSRLASLPASRVGKFIVLIAWLAIVAGVSGPGGKFEDAQENEAKSFLPGDAESTRVLDALDRFGSADVADAVTVFRRDGGLTAADRAAVERLRDDLTATPPPGTAATTGPIVSADSSTALLISPVTVPEDDDQVLQDAVKDIRERSEAATPAGAESKVTGGAGYSADAIKVFENINSTLLIATALLVFVLLVLIYRSPIFWLIPLLSVGFAEITVRGIGYGLAQAGVVINGQTAGILLVLVFGAGTDYALLLVARYREELHRHRDRHDAMRVALRQAGPAILASGLTNVCALLVLMLAEVNGTSGLGPVAAMGVAVAMVAMLTVLPALLAIVGRGAFWPFIPRHRPDGEEAPEERGAWRGLGDRIGRRPRPVWIGTLASLVVLALGVTMFDSGLTSGNGFRGDVGSVQGQEMVARAFPGGTSAPTDVIVPDPASVPRVAAALRAAPGVTAVSEVERGEPGVRLAVVLEPDPYSTAAFDLVPGLRDAVRQADPRALVGGPSATEHDLREASQRDLWLLPPLVLLVILVIIGVLLRAIVAPIVIVATVIVSFLAALGVSVVVFDHIFDFPGSDPSLPLFGFIFLVALGVDYNIFLMARVREEAVTHGTRQGMIRGLAVTGAVITSAGIVLAGTFGVLAVLPLVFLTEIGFLVAFGVLLDTFLVRSVLLPGLVMELDRRVWWPSRLSRGGRKRT